MKRILNLCILTVFILLSGCSSRELNQLAVSIAIGIDKTENGYRITEQILNPKAIAAKSTINEPAVIVFSHEGKDIAETIRSMTESSPRHLYHSHIRTVVFGEEKARDGIRDVLEYVSRNSEFRSDFYFAVAKGTTALEFLKILTRPDSIPGMQIFNTLNLSERTWAPTKTMRITELVNNLTSDGINPVIPGIEITSDDLTTKNIDELKVSDLKNVLKIDGLGVFDKDKLVGWLNEDESKGYNYITNNVKNTLGYCVYKDGKISFRVTGSKAKLSTNIKSKKPAIEVNISTQVDIESVEGDLDVSDPENEEFIYKLVDTRIKYFCESAIKKARDGFKIDIFGFGEEIHRSNPKMWEKLKKNWNDKFKDLPVDIRVKTKLNKLGQITKSYFVKESE